MSIAAIDRALFDVATRGRSERLDRLLYPLSDAATDAKLWFAVAAALGVCGGRTGRRAALRGLASLGVSSFVANLVAKPLANRTRPAPPTDEWLTRLIHRPESPSFPSGHSASAAAFATGVALELPAAGPPLALLATAVGYSRVRTRVHYPGDVVAGLALGAAVALASRKVWQVAPRQPASVARSRRRSDRVVEVEGAGSMVVVVNPGAGSGSESVSMLRDALPEAIVIELGDDDDFGAALDKASGSPVLGIMGGDGSINAAVGVAIEHDRPLAVFPGGTLNHFARDAGLADVSAAADAFRSGELGHVDVGRIDGQPFLNTASFGNYAELVDARERLEPRLGKWLAMAVATARMLHHATPTRVIIDGREVDVWMIFIGNCEYEPSGLAPGWRPRLDDGQFDVRYVDGSKPWSRASLMAAMLIGQLPRSRAYHRTVTTSLTLRSTGEPLRLARDGETFDADGAVVEIRKDPCGADIYMPLVGDASPI